MRQNSSPRATNNPLSAPSARLIDTCAGIFYLQTALDPEGRYFNDYVGALECVQQIVPGALIFDMAANDFV